MKTRIDADVDIDISDRSKLLSVIKHVSAAMKNVTPVRKHPSGIYVVDIPYDPINDMAAIDYKEAEQRGYFKIDLLNVHVYEKVRDEMHLIELMRDPDWSMLKNKHIVEQLVHLNNSYNLIRDLAEPIDSIPRLAMFLAAIRPSKRYLIGRTWKDINEHVWTRDKDGYTFRKSHAIAYAQLVVVHMNLLAELNS